LAQFLHMAVQLKKKLGYTAQLLIEPKPEEPTTHQYDASAAIVIGFLREFNLLMHYKLNLETNHATLAWLTMFHECMLAGEAGMLGGIDVNEGTFGNGWDTDRFLGDPMVAFKMLKYGGLGTGVFNFDAHRMRGSFAPIDHIHGHILGMDTMAWGLRTAAVVMEDGRLDGMVLARYDSWRSDVGRMIEVGKPDLKAIARIGYETPFGVTATQSAHHEAIRSVVLRAAMQAIRAAA
ncbi:MAG: xylose isomerase, partial [Candidatus Staskawiczbacteria bacterium]|nr:xylose isomerase [Candidatus Staskawiczbacteria bacterium]